MPDEIVPAGTPAAPAANEAVNEIKNLKAEMERKFGNVAETNAKLLQQLQAMNAPKTPAEPPKKAKPLSDLVLDDTDEFVRQVESRVDERLNARQQHQNKSAETIAQLRSDFPELAYEDHPLTKKALEIYDKLPADEKTSPMAYKIAVKDAAMEVGIKPKSKRTEAELDAFDGFTMGNTPGERGARARAKADKVSEETLEFARLIGRDTTDPKVVERLKKYSKRNNWMKYE